LRHVLEHSAPSVGVERQQHPDASAQRRELGIVEPIRWFSSGPGNIGEQRRHRWPAFGRLKQALLGFRNIVGERLGLAKSNVRLESVALFRAQRSNLRTAHSTPNGSHSWIMRARQRQRQDTTSAIRLERGRKRRAVI
jgi:hypothetical protein